ncbi:MAG: hypothetical protein LBS62_05385 [Clostridiales bacterium]|jgi:uncharacterized protein (DUF697 family)|nr:hypothetical protein [Clostridiales bacterium]
MSNGLEKKDLAVSAYTLINSKASSNMWLQGISGVVGFPFTTIADVGVIATHYVPMFNGIRRIYGRQSLTAEVIAPLVTNISKELLLDIVFDKVLGNIPLIGIPLNAICAKAMTWRLGILFSMLSSRGEGIDNNTASDAVVVIRGIFPKSAFGFATPPLKDFEGIVNSVYETSHREFSDKVSAAKAALMN